MTSTTEWVVFCPKHQHYLVSVTVAGTTWRRDPAEAKRYPNKVQAGKAVMQATWLDHNPTVWPLAETKAEI